MYVILHTLNIYWVLRRYEHLEISLQLQLIITLHLMISYSYWMRMTVLFVSPVHRSQCSTVGHAELKMMIPILCDMMLCCWWVVHHILKDQWQCHVPEDLSLQQHWGENLKSCMARYIIGNMPLWEWEHKWFYCMSAEPVVDFITRLPDVTLIPLNTDATFTVELSRPNVEVKWLK